MSSKISKTSTKPNRSKSKRGRSKNVAKTKVVVRRLPPLIPENLFFESVKQWVNEETCTWSRFHQGRISKSKNKESILSRAYLHFKTVEQVLEFHRGYDNHLFIDRQGNENRAVVEFAIYQKLPKEHKKPDPRQGTIETDPDYLAFLECLKVDEIQQATAKESGVSLENGATQLERLEARLANAVINANIVEKPTTTPLLEHLRALKLGPKSKSPPPKQTQIAILSPGLIVKGTGPRAAKQSQNRTAQANEDSQFTYKSTRRERKRKEREKERKEKEREKEKEKREKDKKNREANNKDIEKEKGRESEEVDIEKSKEKTKEQGKEKENYRDRERKREKRLERERQKSIREREKKFQATETSKPEPTITIVPRPQTEESRTEAREKEKEKETKKTPVKITIQSRQKEQIRQIIQKTSNPSKKESNTTEDDLKETTHKEPVIKESAVTVQKDVQKEENKERNTTEASITSLGVSKAHTSTSNSPLPNDHRYRSRDRKHSTEIKPSVQIQILTKSQTQSTNTSESNVTTGTSSAASSPTTANASPPIRRTGRGYFGKRGGRW